MFLSKTGLFGVCWFVLVAPAISHGQSIWSEKPFSVLAKDAIADANETKVGDAAVEMLWDSGNYEFDAQGRKTAVVRQVYQIRERSAMEGWGVVHATWEPWHEKRPVIRARVITKDGHVYSLDPQTIEEFRMPSNDSRIFTDRYLVRAPLAGISPGAIVETQIVSEEKRPVATSGGLVRFSFATGVPIRHSVASISIPEDLTLNYKVLGLDIEPTETRKNGRRELVFPTGPQPAISSIEAYLPADQSPIPTLFAGTAVSWSDCANEYSELVDQQISAAANGAAAWSLDLTEIRKMSREKAIRALSQQVLNAVRYTGLEFGSSSFVPQPPSTILQRGYGDCKDMSTLLVSGLREIGIESYVALLSSGTGLDSIPEVPALRVFNHAIVYIPGEPDYWIDLTSPETPIGKIPASDQGRLAMIASGETTGLVRIPLAPSSENHSIFERRVKLSDDGTNRITEQNRYRGVYASSMRSVVQQMDESQLDRVYRNAGVRRYATDDLVDLEVESGAKDGEFTVRATYGNAQNVAISASEAVVVLDPTEALNNLPVSFYATESKQVESQSQESATAASKIESRKSPLHLPMLFRTTVRYEIFPPKGFVAKEVPEDKRIEFGSASFALNYRSSKRGSVTAEFKLDTGGGRFTASQVRDASRAIAGLADTNDLTAWTVPIRFENPAATDLVGGNVVEAIRGYHQLVTQDPNTVRLRCDLATALLTAGLGDAALEQAQIAVELDSQSADAYRTLGTIYSHDRLGNLFYGEFSKEAAIKAFEKAIELEPDDEATMLGLASLSARDADGAIYATQESAQAAADSFTKLYRKTPQSASLDLTLTAHHFAGNSDELRSLLKEAAPSTVRDLYELVMHTIDGEYSLFKTQLQAKHPSRTQQQTVLSRLTNTLVLLREYEAARQLRSDAMSHPVPAANGEALAFGLDELGRIEQADLQGNDPESICKRSLVDGLAYGQFSTRSTDAYANSKDDFKWQRLASQLELFLVQRRALLVACGTPKPTVTDVISLMTFETTGDETTGFRVRALLKLNPMHYADFFMVSTPDGLRLLYPGDDGKNLGKAALGWLKENNEKAARQWLDWAFDRQRGDIRVFNQFAGSPFARIWIACDKNDPKNIEVAAAALASGSDLAQECLKTLDRTRDGFGEIQQLQIDRARLRALRQLGRDEEQADLASRMVDAHPNAPDPFHDLASSLLRLGKAKELVERADARLKRIPNDEPALLALASAATTQGKYDVAEQYLSELVNLRSLSPTGKLIAGRLLLYQPGRKFDQAEGLLRSLVAEFGYHVPFAVKTFAVALASNGKYQDAIAILRNLSVATGIELNRLDRLTQGIIAERSGVAEIAKRYYSRCERDDLDGPTSTYDLAQLRLKRLEESVNTTHASETP
ncbi:Tetratricopeptide repeat protein [Stieleria neptunia]|uniref:Tetratricopeptide repeat protein n=1 Tax=Stieleria neptunia TaxID=2527979 RepID=A0A518HLY4_9BACT|nr:DUF3857 domain-containing protein [Stieleria neptunia]QDV41861.1 Tetratricopeptide repeat protein [Stieleria neptunia]